MRAIGWPWWVTSSTSPLATRLSSALACCRSSPYAHAGAHGLHAVAQCASEAVPPGLVPLPDARRTGPLGCETRSGAVHVPGDRARHSPRGTLHTSAHGRRGRPERLRGHLPPLPREHRGEAGPGRDALRHGPRERGAGALGPRDVRAMHPVLGLLPVQRRALGRAPAQACLVGYLENLMVDSDGRAPAGGAAPVVPARAPRPLERGGDPAEDRLAPGSIQTLYTRPELGIVPLDREPGDSGRGPPARSGQLPEDVAGGYPSTLRQVEGERLRRATGRRVGGGAGQLRDVRCCPCHAEPLQPVPTRVPGEPLAHPGPQPVGLWRLQGLVGPRDVTLPEGGRGRRVVEGVKGPAALPGAVGVRLGPPEPRDEAQPLERLIRPGAEAHLAVSDEKRPP